MHATHHDKRLQCVGSGAGDMRHPRLQTSISWDDDNWDKDLS